jgi:hypothetical protein
VCRFPSPRLFHAIHRAKPPETSSLKLQEKERSLTELCDTYTAVLSDVHVSNYQMVANQAVRYVIERISLTKEWWVSSFVFSWSFFLVYQQSSLPTFFFVCCCHCVCASSRLFSPHNHPDSSKGWIRSPGAMKSICHELSKRILMVGCMCVFW